MADFLLVLDWLIVLAWTMRIISALRNMPRIPNLLDPRYAEPLPPRATPLISVIVPACNEEANIEAALRSLLAIKSVPIEILVIDDRSTDSTGVILDRVAAETDRVAARANLTVIHVTELPPGWIGKPHAMALAARQATAPWLLFTDADVFFAPDSLLRAVNFAQAENADHFVLFPSLILESFGERMMTAIFQVFAFLGARPWRVADPASRDSIGMGAFNLVRAEVYRAVGGFEALRMEVVEDLKLGLDIKRAGYRQRAAFGPGLLRLRWAEGTLHFIRNVTKNFFAVFRFRTLPALAACMVLVIFCLSPFAALAGSLPFRIPAILLLLMMFFLYRLFERYNEVPAAYFLTFPIAATLLIYAVLRSVLVTLLNHGIRWRGTFYPLSELRRSAGPLRQ
ncbi:MAG: glycosyltransferase [Silvibacterium sp.]|nr:glycosyltransferase [Silvibacterium sp.]MBV8435933.1 glycosyltransferase [Silvibacterium sp.]